MFCLRITFTEYKRIQIQLRYCSLHCKACIIFVVFLLTSFIFSLHTTLLRFIRESIMDSDSSVELLSDDDDSFLEVTTNVKDTILISDDEKDDTNENLISDDELPSVDIQAKKSAIIKNLFPSVTKNTAKNKASQNENTGDVFAPSTSSMIFKKPRDPGVNRMIEGVNVNLPVNPYGCQVALMSMLIKAIKRGHNCLLESPTGSGKTLALLCGALGWLGTEKKVKSEILAQSYFAAHPELSQVDGAMQYVASPIKNPPNSHEIFFNKKYYGEKSIYDSSQAPNESKDGLNAKPQQPVSSGDSPETGQVRIHMKRKWESMYCEEEGSKLLRPKPTTPEKNASTSQPDPDSPSSLGAPTIYYGARTHKQLQQVIKEFGRTSYSDQMKMSILSSREHSCVREFDKQMWGTKNDMCRGCVRKIIPKGDMQRSKAETNCKFYDNRQALKHERLPAAFDLEDLVNAAHELTACSYYAAREMATRADIVFCPYNYLIEPSIRNSMRIDLTDNIVIIDEAHNIEDICRDAATYTFTRENIQSALKELEIVAAYKYSTGVEDVVRDVDKLVQIMKNWDDWFGNQSRLLDDAPVNNNEAVYSWEAEHFVKTLNCHNIGQAQYPDFKESSMKFCNQLQNDPRTLIGVTQSTGTLIESIETALGYLFQYDCKFKNDFKPVIVKILKGDNNGVGSWRLKKEKKTESECLSLRLYCMSPAVVFDSLKVARCVVLASGTLAPLISLHSELDAEFPLKISPSHVISPDRVWIGTLTTHPNGRALECKSRDTNETDTQDSLGQAILWVCKVTPHGVLCFVPSYQLMNKLVARWQDTGVFRQLEDEKHVFQENRNARDHNDIMEDYYRYVSTDKGALLFAVYRGKVSEGMDFKDHQARAVVTIGVPYPNTYDLAVKSKMEFNDKYCRERKLLTGQEWLKVQAYRALNQAVGRCVRHKGDWGAVLLIDSRFQREFYTEHLSKWVTQFLNKNHHSFESLVNSPNSLESFMQNMTIKESEDID